MTKREMVEEMIEGLHFTNNANVVENRCKQTKRRIEEVYNYFLKSSKTREERTFCINLLVTF